MATNESMPRQDTSQDTSYELPTLPSQNGEGFFTVEGAGDRPQVVNTGNWMQEYFPDMGIDETGMWPVAPTVPPLAAE